MNDLSDYLNEYKVSLYADDTALYATSASYIDMILSFGIDMATVSEWLKLNELTLNVSKTKLMIFCSQSKLNTVEDVNIEINGATIEQVSQLKYLGMILNQSLTCDNHIDSVYYKGCAKLGANQKARNCLGQKMALNLYKSLVLPILVYVIYDVANKENKNKLQLLQNAACCVIEEYIINAFSSVNTCAC